MAGFATPSAGGITKLSELLLDADKNWADFGITDIKEIVAGMTKGDLLFFDGAIISKVSPGPIGTMFTTQGPGAAPIWSY